MRWPSAGHAAPAAVWDLSSLLNALDPGAELAERNLWLVRLMEWVRHAAPRRGGEAVPDERASRGATPLPLLRIRHLLNLLDRQPEIRARVVELLGRLLCEMDATLLLADFGFAPRLAFFSELGERLQRAVLPGTPQTHDLAELFQLIFSHAEDSQWLAALDEATLERLSRLFAEAQQAAGSFGLAGCQPWHDALLDALTFCVTQVNAAAYSAQLRSRLSPEAQALAPFRQLARAADTLQELLRDPQADEAARRSSLGYFRTLLEACRRDAATVHDHLEEHGVSVDIVFALDQLQGRLRRVGLLLDCLVDPQPAPTLQRLLVQLARTAHRRRSVRALLARNYSLLARKVTERSAETGEHYISRTRTQYRTMFLRAAGGGAITTVTVFLKFLVGSLGLSAFWTGLAAGINYALSFVAIQLAHFTLATKQPAMTAPALAGRLSDLADDAAVERFVDEVAHLMRTQVAGILGNVVVVLPCVLVVQLAWQALTGEPLVGEEKSRHVLESLNLLGVTPLYAAATGVLLFSSSLVAGWAGNWFALHRIGSAVRWNPRIIASLGEPRARRWSAWLQHNVPGLAGNISLGLMLGLLPSVSLFFGLAFDVRHVTLASGQLGAALATLGPMIMGTPAFWLAVLGIVATGALNVTVSFMLAFRLALRARNIRLRDRGRIYAAIRARLLRRPMSFLLPPRDVPAVPG
ncbi:site-specific recombinase [Caldimonas tepidiphila]|uniref:site-specific recombinase n=1 Tax=Caldimonas tepidiphila TaxID=2315841 RepID=UPI000E5AE8AD|nr:site-specific recombinase [Caldimonas tepidiphila]